MKEPTVSICCITYNHINFIRECIEGFIMQKTSFPIEILIFDDASTDDTQLIVKELAAKDSRIRTFLQTENQWSNHKYGLIDWLIPAAKGEYIALCEGDDYWTDPLKLQKQVDFMESNPEYSFCFNDSLIINKSLTKSYLRIGERKIDEIVDLKSVILENNIATASLLFRNVLDWSSLPEWFLKTSKGDYALVVLLAEKGLGKYITDPMSVYRVHEGGVWSGSKNWEYHTKANIEFFSDLKFYFSDPLLKDVIETKLNKEYRNFALGKLRKGFFCGGLKQYILNGGLKFQNIKSKEFRKVLGAIKTGISGGFRR